MSKPEYVGWVRERKDAPWQAVVRHTDKQTAWRLLLQHRTPTCQTGQFEVRLDSEGPPEGKG